MEAFYDLLQFFIRQSWNFSVKEILRLADRFKLVYIENIHIQIIGIRIIIPFFKSTLKFLRMILWIDIERKAIDPVILDRFRMLLLIPLFDDRIDQGTQL